MTTTYAEMAHELRVELEPLVRDHLGPTLDLELQGDHARGQFYLWWVRCSRCHATRRADDRKQPLLSISVHVVEDALPVRWPYSLRVHPEEQAERRRMCAWLAQSIAARVARFACDCVPAAP